MFCLFKYFYPSHSPLGFVISVSFSVLCNSSVNSVDLWTLWEKEMFSPFLVYYLINNYSFLSRQLVQIFVHPKSWQRYLELFYPFFKLPFSYPSHPLLLFPLLFCLLFKLPFSYPFHPLQLFSLLFCLFLSCFFPIHFTRYNSPLCYSVSFLSCLSPPPHNHRYCSFCYSVFFLSCLSPPPPNHRYCFLLLLCLLLPCPFFTFLSHFLIVAFSCYFSSTKAYFR